MTAWLERLDPWLLLGCAAAVAFVLGLVVGLLAGRRPGRGAGPGTVDDTDRGGDVATDEGTSVVRRVHGDEDLVAGLIGAHDLAAEMRATAVQAHVEQVLAGVGVRRIRVEVAGPFDSGLHQAISVERDGSVAGPVVGREIRPGWSDGDAVLRPAEVVVRTP
jgi:hypothetical protein